jgi:hypothetical protein
MYLIPGYVDGAGCWAEGSSSEMNDDWSTSVDHQIKPAVVSGQSETFQWIAAADSDTEKSQSASSHHFTSNNCRSAVLNKYK